MISIHILLPLHSTESCRICWATHIFQKSPRKFKTWGCLTKTICGLNILCEMWYEAKHEISRYLNIFLRIFFHSMNDWLGNILLCKAEREIWTHLSSTRQWIASNIVAPIQIFVYLHNICRELRLQRYLYIWYLHGNAPRRVSGQIRNPGWIETCFPRRPSPIPPALPPPSPT